MSSNHAHVATTNATASATAASLPTDKCSSSTHNSGNGDPGSSGIGSSAFLVSGKNFRKSNAKREPLFFLIIMKLNLKTLLSMLIAIVVITVVIFWSYADHHSWDSHLHKAGSGNELQPAGMIAVGEAGNAVATALQNIECWINQEYTIPCKRSLDSNEVYVPFSFLRSYFDISGVMVSTTSSSGANEAGASDNDEPVPRFSWMHSTAKVNVPRGKYDARGRFAYFENYNVEVRDRVKCISAKEGVPISTQWEKSGYFYPTQIAQFALAHFSKNLSEPPPRIKVFEDADANQMQWLTPKSSNITRIWHPKFNTSVIQYETAIGYDSAVRIDIDNIILDLVLSVDLLLVTNSSSLMVTLQHRDTKQNYRLHYIPADLRLSTQEDNIYYGMGIGALNRWRRLTRDLYIDVQKGIASDKKSATKVRRNELHLVSVAFLGVGFFDNITLSTYDHLAHFYDAAEWFVHNQDTKTGGWPNPVKRSLNGFTELKAGWLSAMGQGHALSVLSRAYYHSGGNKRYLKAAAMGLKPFRVFSKDGGVLAQFMDKYYWYEEYPTTPPSFVLNGFIYSLLGLYDLNTTAPAGIAREAGRLFSQGMQSLKKMLLLYDTGSGTSYDLRHLSLGVPPNLARADYHATHVSQLLLLATIDSDPLIIETAERWKGYMFGKRAKHN